MHPQGRGQGQLTVARRRLAARSNPNRRLGYALTESGQSLHVSPPGTGIRLVLLCERDASAARFRDTELLHDRLKKSLARRTCSWVVALRIMSAAPLLAF
jgi:hypothetical protein